MAFPGQRFVVNLDDDDELTPNVDNIPSSPPSPPSSALIGEIHERAPSAAVPPAPKPPSGSGFPEHKKRFQKSSFKQRRANQQQQQQQQQSSAPTVDDEKKSIDEQNRRQLASMSNAEINEEREELISSLDPGLLERFLRRAKIDDAPQDTPAEDKPELQKSTAKPAKSVSFDVPEPPKQAPPPAAEPKPTPSTVNDDLPPPNLPDDLHPASEIPSFHFPTPPQPSSSSSSSSDQTPVPNLDPSSPSFLADLQSHYFPNIQHDPNALSWLQPPSSDPEDPAAATSAYHPASQADAVHPAAIRFSLVGTVLSPNTSLSLPTSLGLHHHGDDPQAAGYTIPELAILGRSSFPAQRCIAWQVLGRILFRLGRGEFGERGSTLVEGLWFVIEKEGSIALMLAEADGASSSTSSSSASASDSASAPAGLVKGAGIGRHASAAAWAVEGVWLWQKGGGGDRGILKEGVIRPR